MTDKHKMYFWLGFTLCTNLITIVYILLKAFWSIQ